MFTVPYCRHGTCNKFILCHYSWICWLKATVAVTANAFMTVFVCMDEHLCFKFSWPNFMKWGLIFCLVVSWYLDKQVNFRPWSTKYSLHLKLYPFTQCSSQTTWKGILSFIIHNFIFSFHLFFIFHFHFSFLSFFSLFFILLFPASSLFIK